MLAYSKPLPPNGQVTVVWMPSASSRTPVTAKKPAQPSLSMRLPLISRARNAAKPRSPAVGAYLGELVRHGEVAPDWLDRSLELLWALMVQPGGSR